MYIKALPKYSFDESVTQPGIQRNWSQIAFISICEPGSDVAADLPVLTPAPNVHVCFTHDITQEISLVNGEIVSPFSPDQAQSMVDFIKANADKKVWLVHCTMGVSRSGAVVTFIRDYLKKQGQTMPWVDFKRLNPHIIPNQHILKLLTETSPTE